MKVWIVFNVTKHEIDKVFDSGAKLDKFMNEPSEDFFIYQSMETE